MRYILSILLSLSLLLSPQAASAAGSPAPSHTLSQAQAAPNCLSAADTDNGTTGTGNTDTGTGSTDTGTGSTDTGTGNTDTGTPQPPAGDISVSAPSALLMEASTGQVIYEKEPHASLHPASITKIMTMILIFDALEEGKITLEETVTVSEYAASMGGSQVFLEPGETQTVETMLKCISIASANDACVAMAEHIWGSEQEFVSQMNQRAKDLGMKNTNFVNCCGLDVDGHMTTAYDVALMSRELITKYPQIHNYCTIWMENITHEIGRAHV